MFKLKADGSSSVPFKLETDQEVDFLVAEPGSSYNRRGGASMPDQDPPVETPEATDPAIAMAREIDPMAVELLKMVREQNEAERKARSEEAERSNKVLMRFMILFVILLVVNGALSGADIALQTGWLNIEGTSTSAIEDLPPHPRPRVSPAVEGAAWDTGIAPMMEEFEALPDAEMLETVPEP